MKSEFLEWFVAQHGPRTKNGMDKVTDDELKARIQAGKVAAEVLRLRHEWDAQQRSALYAWQAARAAGEWPDERT